METQKGLLSRFDTSPLNWGNWEVLAILPLEINSLKSIEKIM